MSWSQLSACVVQLSREPLEADAVRWANAIGGFTVLDRQTSLSSDLRSDIVLIVGDVTDAEAAALVAKLKQHRPFIIWWSTERFVGQPQDAVQHLRVNLLVEGAGAGAHRAATPEGGVFSFADSKSFFEFVDRRADVQWFKTCARSGPSIPVDAEHRRRGAELLAFAHDTRLLCDKNGNAALRLPKRDSGGVEFLVSPRGVNKAQLRADDLLPVHSLLAERATFCPSLSVKSSIDTGVLGMVFAEFERLDFLLHFHPTQAIVCSDGKTTFPYPCGTVEEGLELIHGIRAVAGRRFVLEMVHHGYLLGGTEAERLELQDEWRRTVDAHTNHLQQIGEAQILKESVRHPIFAEGTPLGVFLVHQEGWGALYVRPDRRGRRLGQALSDAVAARGMNIGAHDDCRVLGFYQRRGWTECGRSGKITFLRPPEVNA